MTEPGPLHDALLAALEQSRDTFHAALAGVDPDLFTAPGLLEAWSARDLVEHMAFWSNHGADALELAASGQGADFAYDSSQTDAMNAETFAASSAMTPTEVLEHEQVAFERFRDVLTTLDPALLALVLGNGDTVEAVIRYDGPDHYAEHAEHIRAWFGDQPASEDDED